jgi:transcription-repair coupling factor (superfamily II helicase)
MTGLCGIWDQMKEHGELCEAIEQSRFPLCCVGLSAIHKAHLVAALQRKTGRRTVVVAPDEAGAVRLAEDIGAFAGPDWVYYYPARELVMREVEGVSREYEFARLNALRRFFEQGGILVASAEAALQHTMPPDVLARRLHKLDAGFCEGPENLIALLSAAGYQRRDQVDGICQYARRGGIVDFFAPGADDPCRVEFWGDEIDSIWSFKLDSQRREKALDRVEISPAREVLCESSETLAAMLRRAAGMLKGRTGQKAAAQVEKDILRLESGEEPASLDRYMPLVYPKPATLLDYLPKEDGLLLLSDPVAQREALKGQEWQRQEDLKQFYEEGLCFAGCDRYGEDFLYLLAVAARRGIVLDTFVRTLPELSYRQLHSFSALQMAPWGGEFAPLLEEVKGYAERNWCVVVMAGTEKGAAALRDDLVKEGLDAHLYAEGGAFRGGQVLIGGGHLSAGFEYPVIRFALIAHLRASSVRRRAKKKSAGDAIRSLSDLTPGDYVVHVNHGIGVFEGIIKREVQGVVKDYIRIRYAGTDMLFVPVTQLDMVSRYIGPREDSAVRLNKLGSAEWLKTRARVKKAVADMAGELIKLYAARQQAKGFSFSPDGEWQAGFEARFPYEETEDQLKCVSEIKQDMESSRPMDRILCGDVGFGKTEVALRAVFKCVMDSKQCAVLVPTTILAWQHYQTFQSRLAGYPVRVELLSRFRTPREQADVIRDIRRGLVDIVIGTHRLIQKDVAFKDLGLCIIDEEQRFGVAHKERFKQLRSEVDVLTLWPRPSPHIEYGAVGDPGHVGDRRAAPGPISGADLRAGGRLRRAGRSHEARAAPGRAGLLPAQPHRFHRRLLREGAPDNARGPGGQRPRAHERGRTLPHLAPAGGAGNRHSGLHHHH